METFSLLSTLKKYFGFESFRPLQEEIIRDILSGRDVFAVLPTGGGKSLCFQLPALLKSGLTVVVSPLIALMKDQVNALEAGGISATFLNSSLDSEESRARLRDLNRGAYRLLYVAPERLALSGFLADLKRWNVNLIAVDEAHCISEWGHDFRPEYRALSGLRTHFPGSPVMALTATATRRVQTDIVQHLQLHRAGIYRASFNRLNLIYRVEPKNNPRTQILDFLKGHPHSSGIIYCQSRKTTESLSGWLNEKGIRSRPYHAGLSNEERSRNQDQYLRDEIQVMTATIAFGMGINKPNVRFVIHYDMPKNIEGYYQETGRAGRDGLASECILLFSAQDVGKLLHFIDEKQNPKEQEIARRQLSQMVEYGQSPACRRKELLGYFGENFTDSNCNACDNCLTPKSTFDGTAEAQKFLSCIYRIRQQSGFNVGLNHIIEVLTGAETEKILRWQHHKISTYAIGKEHSRHEWKAFGRELIRQGLIEQTQDKFSVLEITEKGRVILAQRTPVTLTRMNFNLSFPSPSRPPHSVGRSRPPAESKARGKIGMDYEYDAILFERLRGLRKSLADKQDVPAYIVFSDVALCQMARDYPQSEKEFAQISGVGEKKLREFSQIFLAEIASYLQQNTRQHFSDKPVRIAVSGRTQLNETQSETMLYFRTGKSVEEIAMIRNLKKDTVYVHLLEAIEIGEAIDIHRFVSSEEQEEIQKAFANLGFANLTGVRELLGERFDYGLLKLYRAMAMKQTMR